MIAAVVFSRDRAMQLDALLRSLPPELSPVFAIIRITTPDHQRAYRVCAEDHPEVEWISERSETSLPFLAREMFREATFGCFLTDDSVFYRQPVIPSELPYGVLCHSFRLGMNTTWCYPHDRAQKTPTGAPTLCWMWDGADGDFAYPGSLDGHVFRASHLRRALLTCREDANPNRIEDHLNRWVKTRLASEYPLMTAGAESSLVGIPVNRVNETHPNRVGDGPSADDLCDRYLAGERIDLEAMDFSAVRGAHQEIELRFRR